MGKEYLTVAEYAEIKGISKQAVYKQLNNKLNNQFNRFGKPK